MKKLALILIIMLLFSFGSNEVYLDSLVDINYQGEGINELHDAGLLLGTSNGLELDREMTRIESIVLLVRLIGKEEIAYAIDKITNPFIDVPVWGAKYVEYAYVNGLVKGVSERTFGSTLIVDEYSYLTLMLRTLGYNDSQGDFNWNNASIKGYELGLIDEYDLNNDKLNRQDVATISYRLLGTNLKNTESPLLAELVKAGSFTKETAKIIGVISTDYFTGNTQNSKVIDTPSVTIIEQKDEVGLNVVEKPLVVLDEPVASSVDTQKDNLDNVQNSVNVLDYGAKGDGVTDDSIAIQDAINDASSRKVTLIFEQTGKSYRIAKSLYLKSDTNIIGNNSTLYMDSKSTVQAMVYVLSENNVSIDGLNFKSINNQLAIGNSSGKKTSNIQGIYFQGVDNLTLTNIQMDNLYDGIKFGEVSANRSNININIDNLRIYNARMAILIANTSNFVMRNSLLDASAGDTSMFHCLYISGNSSNISIYDTTFRNAAGSAVNIYNGYTDKSSATNILLDNCSILDVRVGMHIYSKANGIIIKDTTIKNIGLAFDLVKSSDVTFSNVNVTNIKEIEDCATGAFNFNQVTNIKLLNVSINADQMSGTLFSISNDLSDVLISGMKVWNLYNRVLFYSASSGISNLIVENSRFEWNNIETTVIGFDGIDSTVLFDNNEFYNSGNEVSAICYNRIATVTIKNSVYSGFKEIFEYGDKSNSNHTVEYINESVN